MRRAVLAFAIAAGLAIGTAIPTSAIGETQVTLTCSDGTSTPLVVDADTLADLTQAVQAMIDYPAGLTCSLVQNPLGALFGGIALASPGQKPFIVGGGRWQVPCGLLIGGGGSADGGVVARVPGSWSSLGWFGQPQTAQDEGFVWVNIAVNVHQRDSIPDSYFGTLNETIPPQSTSCGSISETHFTSKSTCLIIVPPVASEPPKAYVTSQVTQTSGAPFPAGLNDSVVAEEYVHFGFQDNGNPPGQNPMGTPPTDMLAGPPATPEGTPSQACDSTQWDPIYNLGTADGLKQNGNISVHQ